MDQENKRTYAELEAEVRLLRKREETARAAYESLVLHNEEVRRIRHDMKKHFYALRQLAEGGDPRLIQYLDGLIEADAAVRPVVHSGGALLSGLLNGALSRALDLGVEVRILRDEAPSSLPLPDQDLCALILNLMDNALEAVSAPGIEHPYLNLELFTKGAFFFFSIENARTVGEAPKRVSTDVHQGLGLAIVRELAERNGGMTQLDQEDPTRFRVRVALPLVRAGT